MEESQEMDAQSSAPQSQDHSPLECPVCMETVSGPVGYPCGHTVCWTCHNSMDLERTHRAMRCPVCRTVVKQWTTVNRLLDQILRGEVLIEMRDGSPIAHVVDPHSNGASPLPWYSTAASQPNPSPPSPPSTQQGRINRMRVLTTTTDTRAEAGRTEVVSRERMDVVLGENGRIVSIAREVEREQHVVRPVPASVPVTVTVSTVPALSTPPTLTSSQRRRQHEERLLADQRERRDATRGETPAGTIDQHQLVRRQVELRQAAARRRQEERSVERREELELRARLLSVASGASAMSMSEGTDDMVGVSMLPRMRKLYAESMLPGHTHSGFPYYVEFDVRHCENWTVGCKTPNGDGAVMLCGTEAGLTCVTVCDGVQQLRYVLTVRRMPSVVGLMVTSGLRSLTFYDAETCERLHFGLVASSARATDENGLEVHAVVSDLETDDAVPENSLIPRKGMSHDYLYSTTMGGGGAAAVPTFRGNECVVVRGVGGVAFYMHPLARAQHRHSRDHMRGLLNPVLSEELYTTAYVELHVRMQKQWMFGTESYAFQAGSEPNCVVSPDGLLYPYPADLEVEQLGLYVNTRERMLCLYCVKPRLLCLVSYLMPATTHQRIAVGFASTLASNFAMILATP
ncbi:protein ORF150 [Cyprinid herpesvirus 3]|uniref:Uncharacterized protein n=1 Tax=Cyprinid herpesvirus 3 TaxID=180230 RepID=A4FTP5_CYHV3|nr:protein ORF150 [Cyprinid herpesvirus 3]AOO32867.1 protein ORF150 [Cyprinid herpesvirus 3]AOO33023.1 protein ORF150 [Cyprinid herpesvirus 3]AOO33179.1 protein ORF150 [Cyprinid herpesvirus 3]AOO33337.1 protein ORF150 [Cyprinid herpesvirus 3]